ncbi:MAG: sensor histidine kinase [Ostreibacterium sp.]
MKNHLRSLTQSLSVKLLTVFFLTAIILISVLWFTLNLSFERQFSDTIRPYFSKYLIGLQKEVGFPPNVIKAKTVTEHSPVDIVIEAPNFRWSSNGDFIEKPYLDVKLQRTGKQGIISEVGFYKSNFILRTFNQGYITSFIITEKLDRIPKFHEIGLTLLLTLFFLILLYTIIYTLFHPINTIERGIRQIGNGDIAHRLIINRQDEFGTLASSINKMANNIEQMLEAKRQLLLAISHELRTPITRSKIALSLLEDNHIKNNIIEDINEMESLIHELLESEQLRKNHAPLEYSCININDIIYQVQGRFFEKAPLHLNLDDNLPKLSLDASRIGLAIKNIIKNALTASKNPNDEIIINTYRNKTHLIISIADSGVGIEKSQIPRLTEAFYRTDDSRQRQTGGFGIGLYLIKAIIDVHKGQLDIDSHLNQGTTVSIHLPISDISSKNNE